MKFKTTLFLLLFTLFSVIGFSNTAVVLQNAGVKTGTETELPAKENTETKLNNDEQSKKNYEEFKKAHDKYKGKGDTQENRDALKNVGYTDEQATDILTGDGLTDAQIKDLANSAGLGEKIHEAFVNTINKIESVLGSTIKDKVGKILNFMGVLFGGLAALQLIMSLYQVANDNSIFAIPSATVQNLFLFGFVAYLFQSDVWWNLIQDIKAFFVNAGKGFAPENLQDQLSSTGNVATYIIIYPFQVMGYAFSSESIDLVWRLMFLLVGLGLLFICIKTLVTYLLANIEFDLLGGLASIYLILLIWQQTRSIGMKAFNIILSQSLKLFMVTAMIGLTIAIVEEQRGLVKSASEPTGIFVFVGIMMLMGYLTSIADQNASALISGSGGAASAAGLVAHVGKTAATAIATGGAIAMGVGSIAKFGANLGGAIASGASGSGGIMGGVKGGLSFTGNAISNKFAEKTAGLRAGAGGISDALRGMKNGEGFKNSIKTGFDSFRNNQERLSAKQQKNERTLRKQALRNKIDMLAEGAKLGVNILGGQQSILDAKKQLRQHANSNQQRMNTLKAEGEDIKRDMQGVGMRGTEGLTRQGVERYANSNLDGVSNNIADTSINTQDQDGKFINDGNDIFDVNGNIAFGNTNQFDVGDDVFSKVQGESDEYGNNFFVSKNSGNVYRSISATETIDDKLSKNIVTGVNGEGANVKFIKVGAVDKDGNFENTPTSNSYVSQHGKIVFGKNSNATRVPSKNFSDRSEIKSRGLDEPTMKALQKQVYTMCEAAHSGDETTHAETVNIITTMTSTMSASERRELIQELNVLNKTTLGNYSNVTSKEITYEQNQDISELGELNREIQSMHKNDPDLQIKISQANSIRHKLEGYGFDTKEIKGFENTYKRTHKNGGRKTKFVYTVQEEKKEDKEETTNKA